MSVSVLYGIRNIRRSWTQKLNFCLTICIYLATMWWVLQALQYPWSARCARYRGQIIKHEKEMNRSNNLKTQKQIYFVIWHSWSVVVTNLISPCSGCSKHNIIINVWLITGTVSANKNYVTGTEVANRYSRREGSGGGWSGLVRVGLGRVRNAQRRVGAKVQLMAGAPVPGSPLMASFP